jgi:hypothetical protein
VNAGVLTFERDRPGQHEATSGAMIAFVPEAPSGRATAVTLDRDGLLRRGPMLAILSLPQRSLLLPLLEAGGGPVARTSLAVVQRRAGASATRAAVRSALHRVELKLDAVGLELRAIHPANVQIVAKPSHDRGGLRHQIERLRELGLVY